MVESKCLLKCGDMDGGGNDSEGGTGDGGKCIRSGDGSGRQKAARRNLLI